MARSFYMGGPQQAPWEFDARLRERGEFVGQRGLEQRGADAARDFRWATCLHEAGHGLAAAAYRIIIKRLAAHAPPDHPEWGGYITTAGGEAWGNAVLNVAGRAAERWFTGATRRESGMDLANATRNLQDLPGVRDINVALDHARAAADELLRRHREQVERLARELDSRDELSGDEAMRILGHIVPGPPCPADFLRAPVRQSESYIQHRPGRIGAGVQQHAISRRLEPDPFFETEHWRRLFQRAVDFRATLAARGQSF
jgi:hypothetical protein